MWSKTGGPLKSIIYAISDKGHDRAKLEGCILGKNTKIGIKAELSRCVTRAGYEVDAGETFRGEKLDVSDWTAVVGDEEEDGEEEEETSEEEDA